MKLAIVLACCLLALLSLASAEEVKPTTSELTDETSSDVQVADQNADEWYGRRYYGPRYHYNPYGYNVKSFYGGHWRGRRSAPSAAEEDQKADASSNYPGYYRDSYYRPYPYYNRHYYPSSSYSYRYY